MWSSCVSFSDALDYYDVGIRLELHPATKSTSDVESSHMFLSVDEAVTIFITMNLPFNE